MTEAFWLNPDWSGGNTRSGGRPFWMLSPLKINPVYCSEHGLFKSPFGHCGQCVRRDGLYDISRLGWVMPDRQFVPQKHV